MDYISKKPINHYFVIDGQLKRSPPNSLLNSFSVVFYSFQLPQFTRKLIRPNEKRNEAFWAGCL